MTLVRVAVVGLGNIARHVHLPLLRKLRRSFTVVAVCDSQPGYAVDVAEQYRLPDTAVFTDAEEMLAAGGFEAVLILTSGSHSGLAAAAMRLGYAVFCEKPLAHDLGAARELADIEAGFPTPRLMLGYMKQYDPAVTRAAQLLQEAGGPGMIRSIDVSVLHPPEQFPNSDDPSWPPAEPPVQAPERYTGDRERWEYRALVDSVSHDMSLIRLFGGIGSIECDAAASWGADEPHPGSLEFLGPLPYGRYSVRWHYLPHYPRYRELVTVHHRYGSLDMQFSNPYHYSLPTTLTEHGADRRSRIQVSDRSGFELELDAFHRMVTEGRRPLSGIAEGTADIRTALAVTGRLDKWRDHQGGTYG